MSQGESLAAIPPAMPASPPDAATPGATAPGENGEGMPFSLLFEVARNEVASDAGGADTPADPAMLMAIVGQVTAADGKNLPPVVTGPPNPASVDGIQNPLPVMTALLNPVSADGSQDLPPLAAVKSDSQNMADGAGDPVTLAASMGPGLPPALQTVLPPQNDAIVGGETEIPPPAAKPATPLRPAAPSLPTTAVDTDAGAQYLPQPSEIGKQTAEPQQVPALTAGLVKDAEQRLPPSREATPAIATVADAARHFSAVPADTSRVPVTAPAIPVPVDHPQWGQALGERVLWCVNRNSSTAQLSLNPPDLGPLEIRISLDQDRAHVLFVSPHETVREAIGAAVPRLQDMLGEAGIQLLDVGIERHAGGRQPQAFLPPAPHGPGHAEESATDAMELGTRMAAGLVDYYI